MASLVILQGVCEFGVLGITEARISGNSDRGSGAIVQGADVRWWCEAVTVQVAFSGAGFWLDSCSP